MDGDQQRIWYPRTGRTIPFSSLDITPLIVYPQREEEGSQSGTRRVQHHYSSFGLKLDIREQDIEYPGGVYSEDYVEYGIMFDVADRPIVTDGVQFWWGVDKEETTDGTGGLRMEQRTQDQLGIFSEQSF